MVRVLSAAAVAAMAAGSASATTLFFKNQCGHQLDLWNNHEMIPVPPGGSYTRGLPGGWTNQNGMWRHGRSPEATLFEWTMDKGKIWYDLSIIPTKEGGPGPGNCQNFDECKRVTGGKGFNVALQAAPRSNINGINCRVVTCMEDGCDGAYLYPFNDKKKMADCPDNTDFDIIFCPGGPGGPTPPPTPPPTTPAPTTPEPTTPEPTVEDRSIDDLTGGGLNEGSAMNESGVLSPTVEVPTKLPEPETEAPKEDTTAAGEAMPAVEANTQSSGEGGGAVGTLFIVLGVVAAAAAAAFIVVIRRKKAALEAAEDKDSLSLVTPVGTSAL